VRPGPEIERLRISSAIPDASPLIFLFRSGYDWIFPRLYENVFIAEAVWQEVVAGKDEAARLLPEASWAKRKGGGIAPRVAVFNLGSGESEVLSLALNSPGCHEDFGLGEKLEVSLEAEQAVLESLPRGDGSQPKVRRSDPSVTCLKSYEFFDCSRILASA